MFTSFNGVWFCIFLISFSSLWQESFAETKKRDTENQCQRAIRSELWEVDPSHLTVKQLMVDLHRDRRRLLRPYKSLAAFLGEFGLNPDHSLYSKIQTALEGATAKIRDQGFSSAVRTLAEDLEITMREAALLLFYTENYFGPQTPLIKQWYDFIFSLKSDSNQNPFLDFEESWSPTEKEFWLEAHRGDLHAFYLNDIKHRVQAQLAQGSDPSQEFRALIKEVHVKSLADVKFTRERGAFGDKFIIKGLEFVLPFEAEAQEPMNTILLYELREFLNSVLSLKDVAHLGDHTIHPRFQLYIQVLDREHELERTLSLSDFAEKYGSIVNYNDHISKNLQKFRKFVSEQWGSSFIHVRVPRSTDHPKRVNHSHYYTKSDIDLVVGDQKVDESYLRTLFLEEIRSRIGTPKGLDDLHHFLFEMDSDLNVKVGDHDGVHWTREEFIFPQYRRTTATSDRFNPDDYYLPLASEEGVPRFQYSHVAISAVLTPQKHTIFKSKTEGALEMLFRSYSDLKDYKTLNKRLLELNEYLVSSVAIGKVNSLVKQLPDYTKQQIMESDNRSQRAFSAFHKIVQEYNLSVALYNHLKKGGNKSGLIRLIKIEELHRAEVAFTAINQIMANNERLFRLIHEFYPKMQLNFRSQKSARSRTFNKNYSSGPQSSDLRFVKGLNVGAQRAAKVDTGLTEEQLMVFRGHVHQHDGGMHALAALYLALFEKGSIYYSWGALSFFNRVFEIVFKKLGSDPSGLRQEFLSRLHRIPFGKFDGQEATKPIKTWASVHRILSALRILQDLEARIRPVGEPIGESERKNSNLPWLLTYNEVNNFIRGLPGIESEIDKIKIKRQENESDHHSRAISNAEKRELREAQEAYRQQFPPLTYKQKLEFKDPDRGSIPILYLRSRKDLGLAPLSRDGQVLQLFEEMFRLLREAFKDQSGELSSIDGTYARWKSVGNQLRDGHYLSNKPEISTGAFDRVYHSLRLMVGLCRELALIHPHETGRNPMAENESDNPIHGLAYSNIVQVDPDLAYQADAVKALFDYLHYLKRGNE